MKIRAFLFSKNKDAFTVNLAIDAFNVGVPMSKRFIKIMNDCSQVALNLESVDQGLRSYLTVFQEDLELNNALFVVEDNTISLSDQYDQATVKYYQDYFERNNDVEYVKTTLKEHIDYIYSIQSGYFVLLQTKIENDNLLLDDGFISFISSLFYHSIQVLDQSNRRE